MYEIQGFRLLGNTWTGSLYSIIFDKRSSRFKVIYNRDGHLRYSYKTLHQAFNKAIYLTKIHPQSEKTL